MATLLDYALTTVDDVKETLGIDSSVTTYDNLITRKINQATEMIEGYCGRRFAETDYVEYYDGPADNSVVLQNRPVVELTSISYRDNFTNDGDYTDIDASDYFVDANAGVVNAISSFWGNWDRWRITYTAGYDEIPSDLAEACASLAAYLYNNDASAVAGINMKKEGTREIQYNNSKVQYGSGGASANNLITQLGLQVTLDRYADTPISGER